MAIVGLTASGVDGCRSGIASTEVLLVELCVRGRERRVGLGGVPPKNHCHGP